MASLIDDMQECRQCDALFRATIEHTPVVDKDGRVFCSIRCMDEYEMRQGELQTERRLS